MTEWLERNVQVPGETLSVEKLTSLLGGKHKPDWIEVRDVEAVAGSPSEDDTHETLGKSSSLSVGSFKEGSVVLGHYLIERELGEGGMGKAYLARDQKTMSKMLEHVVIKVPHLETAHDPHAVERFVKEADTLTSLRDDRIAACYGSPLLGETPILIMEYVEGVSLDKFLAERDSLPGEQETRELLRPIAQALDYAHQKKIYHLDVKPQNIIVRAEPKAGLKTCLLDFGISKKARPDGSTTFTMSVTGTPLYMSQEQRNGEPATAAMDVYSLAVTAYECLTGKMPYPHGQSMSHVVCPLPSDSLFARAISHGLDINPSRRPRTCAELIDPLCGMSVGQTAASTEAEDQEARSQPGMDSLPDLAKTFDNYRMMLAQSAMLVSRDDAGLAEWMRDRQAALRDLTKDLSRAEPQDLADFFLGVKAKLAELKVGPDDFFLAADRLTELRCGLPKQGGPIWQIILESVMEEGELK